MEIKKDARSYGPSGPLYELLVTGLPDLRVQHSGAARISVHELAELLGYSHQGIYKRLNAGSMTPDMARKIIALSEKQEFKPEDYRPLTYQDFGPYLT